MATLSCSMSRATTLESSPLSTKRAAVLFSSNARDRFSISSNVLRSPLGRVVVLNDRQTQYLDNSERRCFSAWSPSFAAAAKFCLNLFNRGINSSTFPFTSSQCWGVYVRFVRQPSTYTHLIMLDERVHETQGGLEGREAVGGFFRNVE